MATKNTEAAAPAAMDQQRVRVALLMVSDLFGGARIPRPGTAIDQWTKQISVQIAFSAKLNTSPRPSQNGYGWQTVFASEIGGCKFIEDLIGLVYSKLQPGVTPHAEVSEHVEEFVALLSRESTNTPGGEV